MIRCVAAQILSDLIATLTYRRRDARPSPVCPAGASTQTRRSLLEGRVHGNLYSRDPTGHFCRGRIPPTDMISLYINLRLSSFFRCRVSDMHVTDGQTDGLTDGEHCLLRTAAPVAPGQFIPPFYMV